MFDLEGLVWSKQSIFKTLTILCLRSYFAHYWMYVTTTRYIILTYFETPERTSLLPLSALPRCFGNIRRPGGRALIAVAACHRSGWHHAEDSLQCQTLTGSASSWLPRVTMRSIAASCCSSSKHRTSFTFYGFIPCSRTGCVWGKMGYSVLFYHGLKFRVFPRFPLTCVRN